MTRPDKTIQDHTGCRSGMILAAHPLHPPLLIQVNPIEITLPLSPLWQGLNTDTTPKNERYLPKKLIDFNLPNYQTPYNTTI